MGNFPLNLLPFVFMSPVGIARLQLYLDLSVFARE